MQPGFGLGWVGFGLVWGFWGFFFKFIRHCKKNQQPSLYYELFGFYKNYFSTGTTYFSQLRFKNRKILTYSTELFE